ncbi:MAG: multidrug ABC transporter substrate-binding protein [Candidatus Komeilibacteria bacterium CG11_big_fil_rev_8_21_14_0_20_36_20]|uniref:Multidrug ABC transporter substrate-binding protein n=1 Tax=Candidatus Komeilibacteria bacterium CG11_big_fil_rev_8_21_14_0_20_36_20 TaxID=1974477 RepID=A0A2H0NDA8_9BACT|nr:MAG: multidrug ABC transporter substrate-binding protein [Candidatus Komeilibacteria bacterium CG11_big_fil_rev_8_21_14_0_20_36_20]PIR81592.1 MAG: multidrug ABC transporter substrate-binding protein [Candidatus Komeilibacteria bacterium CG10_big_fil_rev_8_21_14_0_10_36_65]PJC55430.1 MAG: multidrug ABC transporter substrate-binding protein [Candidatus Komeilibacteria bacterium CG_4_9_14_0_2_um_filter_36_13]
MNIFKVLTIARQAIAKNKLRTFFTVLGIVIGITAVSVIVSAGRSVEGLIFSQMESFGSNLIQTEVRVPKGSGGMATQVQGVVITTMTLGDKEAIDNLPNIKRSYAAEMSQELLSWNGNIKSALVYSTTYEFIDIDSSEIESGRFYTEQEDNNKTRVVVLGQQVKEDLFGESEAIGQNIKIRKVNFKVIGVLKPRGSVMFFDMDNLIYTPIQTAQKLLLGIDHVSAITAQMNDANLDEQTVNDIRTTIRERHDITNPDKDDFETMSMSDAQNIMGNVLGGITLLLIALASISLIVGGVGIMNIMYASVAERTFEIGLRKSIGASQKNIMTQFLMEAIIITSLGGLGGVVLGLIITYFIYLLANYYNFDWSFSISLGGIILAMLFSTAVGLVFGLYPAKKAADLDPITALRKE